MRRLHVAVLLLSATNAVVADFAYALQEQQSSLPLSPIVGLALLAASLVILRSPRPEGLFAIIPPGLLLAACLVPSSLVAWIALFAVSAAGLALDRERRVAHQLPLALAVTQIWKAVAFKVAAEPITGIEAQVLGWLLAAFGFSPEVEGNAIRVTSEHTLILLAGCSAFANLGSVVLGAIALFRIAAPNARLPYAFLGCIVVAVIGLNLARLILMAISPDWHRFMHDGPGASLFDAVICGLVVVVGIWPNTATTARRGALAVDRDVRAKRRIGLPHATVAMSVLLVALSSLAAKWVRYGASDISGRATAEVRLSQSLGAAGFQLIGKVPLTVDGAIEALVFDKATCGGPLFISFVGSNGGTALALSRYLRGAPVALVLDGQVFNDWAMLRFVAANLAGAVGQLRRAEMPTLRPLLSVSPPPSARSKAECRWLERAMPGIVE